MKGGLVERLVQSSSTKGVSYGSSIPVKPTFSADTAARKDAIDCKDGMVTARGRALTGARTKQGIRAGRLTWQIDSSLHPRGGEKVHLGIWADDNRTVDHESTESKAFMLRAYTGALYGMGGLIMPVPGGGAADERSFHPNETLTFSLELGSGTSPGRFTVKTPRGDFVLSTDVPAGKTWYPAFSANHNGSKSEIMSMRFEPASGDASAVKLGGAVGMPEVAASIGSKDAEAAMAGTSMGAVGAQPKDIRPRWNLPASRGELELYHGDSGVQCEGKAGAILHQGITRGVLQWSITTSGHARGTEHSLLGIAPGQLGSGDFADAGRCAAILIRSFDGRLWLDGREGSPESDRDPFLVNHPGDIVKFELDLNNGTLPGILAMETRDGAAIVRGDIPPGVWHPCFFAFGGGASCRVTQLKFFDPMWNSEAARRRDEALLLAGKTPADRAAALQARIPRGLMNPTWVDAGLQPASEGVTAGAIEAYDKEREAALKEEEEDRMAAKHAQQLKGPERAAPE